MVGSMRPSQLFKPWISFHDSLKGGSSKLPNVSSSWSSSGVRLEAEEEHLRVSEGLVFGKTNSSRGRTLSYDEQWSSDEQSPSSW